MALFQAHRSVEVHGRSGRGITSMVVQKADGRRIAYISMAWGPPTNLRYRRAFHDHIASLDSPDEIYVEVPDHPIPVLRKRRRHA